MRALLVAMPAVGTYPLLVLQQFLGLVLIQLLDAVKRVRTVVRQICADLVFMQQKARKALSFRLIITSCPAAISNHAKI